MLHTGVSGEQATSNYLANYMTPPPPPPSPPPPPPRPHIHKK